MWFVAGKQSVALKKMVQGGTLMVPEEPVVPQSALVVVETKAPGVVADGEPTVSALMKGQSSCDSMVDHLMVAYFVSCLHHQSWLCVHDVVVAVDVQCPHGHERVH